MHTICYILKCWHWESSFISSKSSWFTSISISTQSHPNADFLLLFNSYYCTFTVFLTIQPNFFLSYLGLLNILNLVVGFNVFSPCFFQVYSDPPFVLLASFFFAYLDMYLFVRTRSYSQDNFMTGAAAAATVASVVSDSVRPQRRQPTRLPCPWDSPGKNTGVGGHFLLQCRKVKSESEVAQSCLTLSDPMDCSLPASSVHGIFQARVLEWGAIPFSYDWCCPPRIHPSIQTHFFSGCLQWTHLP